jgi:hypothetical protein
VGLQGVEEVEDTGTTMAMTRKMTTTCSMKIMAANMRNLLVAVNQWRMIDHHSVVVERKMIVGIDMMMTTTRMWNTMTEK